MVFAPTPLGKGSTRAWGLMPSPSVGFDVFRETHKQNDNPCFRAITLPPLLDKDSGLLTRRDKGLRITCEVWSFEVTA
jgi:hypothetical protein